MANSPITPDQNTRTANQMIYVDNIKVLLTILVVLHHTFIAYSSSDGWYYNEPTSIKGAKLIMTMFVSVNQSFFMGFFFLLAAYFTGASYNRKVPSRFVKDRLIRLGIPLVFYSLILTPFMCYLVYYFGKGGHVGIMEYLSGYDSWIDPGVTWFIAALLLFTLIYVVIRRLFNIGFNGKLAAPGLSRILQFAFGLGIISFVLRIIFPVGFVLKPLGFQLGHFPQYVALFIVGLLAAKNKWFDQLPDKLGMQLKRSAYLCLLFFPVFFVIALKLNTPVAYFSGGFHLQALIYAIWEQWIGISILTALLINGKKRWNNASKLSGQLARSSFAVYIFHPLIIVVITLAFRNLQIDGAVKLLMVAPLTVLFSFLFGSLIILIPGVKKIM